LVEECYEEINSGSSGGLDSGAGGMHDDDTDYHHDYEYYDAADERVTRSNDQ